METKDKLNCRFAK